MMLSHPPELSPLSNKVVRESANQVLRPRNSAPNYLAASLHPVVAWQGIFPKARQMLDNFWPQTDNPGVFRRIAAAFLVGLFPSMESSMLSSQNESL